MLRVQHIVGLLAACRELREIFGTSTDYISVIDRLDREGMQKLTNALGEIVHNSQTISDFEIKLPE